MNWAVFLGWASHFFWDVTLIDVDITTPPWRQSKTNSNIFGLHACTFSPNSSSVDGVFAWIFIWSLLQWFIYVCLNTWRIWRKCLHAFIENRRFADKLSIRCQDFSSKLLGENCSKFFWNKKQCWGNAVRCPYCPDRWGWKHSKKKQQKCIFVQKSKKVV